MDTVASQGSSEPHSDVELTIVVPIHGNLAATLRFLASFEAQTRASRLIFVDDRSPDDSVEVLRRRGYEVVEPAERLYFNGILNHAIESCRTPYLGVLNNDLVLGARFVELTLQAFERSGSDFLVPYTFEDPGVDPAELEKLRRFRIVPLRRQQGWCMLFRADAVRALPRVPPDLRLWFGDSWLFHHAVEGGLKVGIMMHNPVIHERHATIKRDASFQKTGTHPVIEEDKRVFAAKYGWVKTKRLGAWKLVPRWLRRRFVPFG